MKIVGKRGGWLAEAEGRFLPVIHDTWLRGDKGYLDAKTDAKTDGKRYVEYIGALERETHIILQRDKPGSLARAGYIGIFTFSDLNVRNDGSISLTLGEKHAEPAT